MRGKPAAILVVALLLLCVGTSTAAAAAAEKIPVSAILVDAGYLDPGTEWYTGGQQNFVAHLRDASSWEQLAGSPYLQGIVSVTDIDFDVALRCDTAYASCSVSGAIHVKWRSELEGFDGGWEGVGNVRVLSVSEQGFRYEGYQAADGWGDLEGWRLFTSVWHDADMIKHWDGYVLQPHA